MAKTKYIAAVGLTNDKTGKRFESGEKVTDKDFPKSVIAAWVKRGHLVEVDDGRNSNDG